MAENPLTGRAKWWSDSLTVPPFNLASDEVHCWSVRLDVPADALAGRLEILTCDERNRATRLRFERDRQRFIVARGALRELLGRYVGTSPDQIRFAYNAFGKPALSSEFGGRLKFNLSHSADLALIAVAAGAELGVDVEYMAPGNYTDIARCFFTPDELKQLRTVPDDLHAREFFSCWTKKEAYAKALGEGLADDPVEPRGRWTFFSLEPAPGYIGAVAVEETAGKSLRLFMLGQAA